jgi:hypothetical protein
MERGFLRRFSIPARLSRIPTFPKFAIGGQRPDEY